MCIYIHSVTLYVYSLPFLFYSTISSEFTLYVQTSYKVFQGRERIKSMSNFIINIMNMLKREWQGKSSFSHSSEGQRPNAVSRGWSQAARRAVCPLESLGETLFLSSSSSWQLRALLGFRLHGSSLCLCGHLCLISLCLCCKVFVMAFRACLSSGAITKYHKPGA